MKIFHISDLHFGMQQPFIEDHFFKEIETIKPDIILISGDVTQRATSEQFLLFSTFLKKIDGMILVVPGNHDIPLHNFFSRLFSPFKRYNRYVSNNLTSQFENNRVRILGVNSVDPSKIKNGKLSSATLSYIKSYFEPSFNGINILFFHHNFDYLEGLHKPLENYQLFLNYLKDSPIHIVSTGHSHYANITLIEKNNHRSCLILHAGSLLCLRKKDGVNSYYSIETNEHSCKIDWRVFKDWSFQTLSTQEIDFK